MRSDEVGREIRALDEQVAALEAAYAEQSSAVDALKEQFESERGRLALLRRAIADHQQKAVEKRSELDEALAEEARQRVERILQERRQAAKSAAEAAEVLLDRLALLDRLRDAALAEREEAAPGSTLVDIVSDRAQPAIETYPDEMRDSWERLCQEIRKRIHDQFENDLVEAAARSPMGHAISDLPVHLHELARQRHRALVRQHERKAKRPRGGTSNSSN
jgi:hypothetical protein